MAGEAVLHETRDNIAFVTLNRPERRNALSREVATALRAAFAKIQQDKTIRAVILTGSENSFCAGADIKDPQTHATASIADYLEGGHIWDYIPRLTIPVIAAINGYAFGAGMELALRCDILIASDRAQLGLQHIRWGLYPAGGGAARMAAAAGKAQAMYYVLTGEVFNAHKALEMGIVSKVVPHDELLDAAKETGRTIAQWSPVVVRYAKDCIWDAVEGDMKQLAEADRYRNFTLYSSRDREEGHRAFVGKRAPQYKGQ